MRELNSGDLSFVFGGQAATASNVEGCGPVRETDVVVCAQGPLGNAANDIASGAATVVSKIWGALKSLLG